MDAGEERIGAELALAHLGVMEPPERTPAEYLKRYYKSRANDWSKAAWDENTERYKGYEIVSRILDFNSAAAPICESWTPAAAPARWRRYCGHTPGTWRASIFPRKWSNKRGGKTCMTRWWKTI